MKSDNGIPIPDKDFYDVGIVVDNYKINMFTKALGKDGAGYHIEMHPFTNGTTTLKIMQVPKAALETLQNVIKQLNAKSKYINNKN